MRKQKPIWHAVGGCFPFFVLLSIWRFLQNRYIPFTCSVHETNLHPTPYSIRSGSQLSSSFFFYFSVVTMRIAISFHVVRVLTKLPRKKSRGYGVYCVVAGRAIPISLKLELFPNLKNDSSPRQWWVVFCVRFSFVTDITCDTVERT